MENPLSNCSKNLLPINKSTLYMVLMIFFFNIYFCFKIKNKKSLIKNVQSTLIPLAWLDESVELNGETLDKIVMVTRLVKVATIVPLIFLCIGLLLVIVSLFLLAFKFLKKRKTI